MSDMPATAIEHFMQRDFVLVREKVSAVEAAVQMTKQRIGCLVVHDEGGDSEHQPIVGLISEADLVRKVMASDSFDLITPVGQFMGNELQMISANRSMLDSSYFMEKHGVRHLCVSDDEEIIGLILIRDLVRYRVYAESGPIRELDNVYRPLSVLMHTIIERIDQKETVHNAAQRMAAKHIGALFVLKDEEVSGIITERDLIQETLATDQDPVHIQFGEVMIQPLIAIDINRTVHDASDFMAEKWFRHLPVTENGTIVGILSVRDLIRMVALRDRPRFLRQKWISSLPSSPD